MYLSRLFLNTHSRQVRSELANPYEMHRTVMRAFSNTRTDMERVLFRIDVNPYPRTTLLLVQSEQKPNWSFLSEPGKNYLQEDANVPFEETNPAIKEVIIKLRTGQNLAFRLRANPTIKKGREDKENGHRIALVKEDQQLQWLKKKFEKSGAILLSANASNKIFYKMKVHHKKEEEITISYLTVQFDGFLFVKEPTAFEKILQSGIGSSKGFGCGLLSIAPIR